MKTKNMYKIGLSLLIALAFILPSGSFMAGSMVSLEADDTPNVGVTEPKLPGIYSQAEPVLFGGLQGENGDGEFFDIFPDVTIPLDCYDLWVNLLKPDNLTAIGKPHIEIYKLDEGIKVTMYETSFEDNYDIYNNWIQIDADCGIVGGQYDSWTWSDARASPDDGGDHSMKSSMYDIYKGNQDDYLVCRQVFDVCDQYAINVSFDVWAEGDYDDADDGVLTPYDFASFEIGDSSGWITNLTLDEEFGNEYKFFDTTLPLYNSRIGINVTEFVTDLGNGWWHVYFYATQADLIALGLNCSEIQFRFDWHTDPQFQYEGAYIDNFKVVSIESDMEKIYQGHSQGPIDIDHHDFPFMFPLNWCPEEGCYRAIVWLEVLDIDHESTFDWPGIEIDFCVGDDIDCEITDLTVEDSFTEEIVADGGIMIEGSDAHIMFTYHNGGNIPMENVAITCTVNKFSWETLFSTDYEVTLSPWPLTGKVHITDYDAYSGSKSLGWFDKDTMEYDIDAFWYTYSSEISLEGVEEMYMDYYWKANTDAGDFVCPATIDNEVNTLLGSGFSAGAGTRMTGLEPDWIGPTEQVSKYHRLDVLALYDNYLGLGYLRDSYGVPVTEIPIGFFMTTDGDDQNRDPNAIDEGIYWSGVFLDDVSITQKAIGEEVFTDTIIIPGPIEPCETYEAQFEWENVPFSNYQICVEAECEGDIEPEDNIMCQQILVLDNLEHATLKATETVDYTGECDEGWGICTSDYDNYLSTNPDSHFYAADSGAIIQLCPNEDDDYPSCIPYTNGSTALLEFDNWYEIEDGWDYVYLEVYDGCPEDVYGANWTIVETWTGFSGDELGADDDDWVHQVIDLAPFVTGDFQLRFRLESDAGTEARGFIIDNLFISDGVFEPWSYGMDLMDNLTYWCEGCFAYGDYWDDWCIYIPSLEIDNALIWSTEINDAYEAYLIVDHEYSFQTFFMFMEDWTSLVSSDWSATANFTQTLYGPTTVPWGLNYGPGYGNIIYWPFFGPADTTDAALSTKVLDLSIVPAGLDVYVDMNQNAYNSYGGTTEIRAVSPTSTLVLSDSPGGDATYSFDPYDLNEPDQAQIEAYCNWDYFTSDLWQYYGCDVYASDLSATGYIEISSDGGATWQILDIITGASGGVITSTYDITPWAGNDILIRFRVEGIAEDPISPRFWCLDDIMISGKTDETAPTSKATMSGTMKESGWYTTGVQVSITATDNVGMGEIHYILDGSEHVVSGDHASFTVSGNGQHNIEFWAIDSMGNVETPHHIIPTFRIDSGSPPSVAITAPEPGLYLFGNKLLSASKVIIIGAFTVEATASDAESGIYRVQFFLDGDLISEDTEMPFSAYVAEKHMGAGTIKVVAEDFAQNTAEDTLDITYYKFL